jgi:hypothetical protein
LRSMLLNITNKQAESVAYGTRKTKNRVMLFF